MSHGPTSHEPSPASTSGPEAHAPHSPPHDEHAAAHDEHATAHDEHGASHPHVNYLAIFIALCVCTALSVVLDVIDMNKRLLAVLVLAVAVAKAQYVMRYFMHLKFEGLWKYVLLLPTVILACGLPLALAPDVALHYYTPERNLRIETMDLEGGVSGETQPEQAAH